MWQRDISYLTMFAWVHHTERSAAEITQYVIPRLLTKDVLHLIKNNSKLILCNSGQINQISKGCTVLCAALQLWVLGLGC